MYYRFDAFIAKSMHNRKTNNFYLQLINKIMFVRSTFAFRSVDLLTHTRRNITLPSSTVTYLNTEWEIHIYTELVHVWGGWKTTCTCVRTYRVKRHFHDTLVGWLQLHRSHLPPTFRGPWSVHHLWFLYIAAKSTRYIWPFHGNINFKMFVTKTPV